MKEKLIRDGKELCWRCGMERKSQEIREGWKCSGWGETYPTHLWLCETEPQDGDLITK